MKIIIFTFVALFVSSVSLAEIIVIPKGPIVFMEKDSKIYLQIDRKYQNENARFLTCYSGLNTIIQYSSEASCEDLGLTSIAPHIQSYEEEVYTAE